MLDWALAYILATASKLDENQMQKWVNSYNELATLKNLTSVISSGFFSIVSNPIKIVVVVIAVVVFVQKH